MNKKQPSTGRRSNLRAGAIAVLTAIGITLGVSGAALAQDSAISGATGWGPCNWYTSNNVRYTSGHVTNIQAKITTAGKLGVKMRIKNEYTGNTSATQYFPAASFKTFASAKGYPAFRMEFTCTNPRKNITQRPDTDFSGTLRD